MKLILISSNVDSVLSRVIEVQVGIKCSAESDSISITTYMEPTLIYFDIRTNKRYKFLLVYAPDAPMKHLNVPVQAIGPFSRQKLRYLFHILVSSSRQTLVFYA